MKTKLKYTALMLGLISLLAAPAGAQIRSVDQAAGSPPYDQTEPMLAAGSDRPDAGQAKAAAEPPAPSTNPELIAADPLFEFGRVLEGTEVVHDFLIENRGGADLAIDQVRTG